MALPNINIHVGNGALGQTIPTNDALAGMLLQGPAPAGVALLVPVLITSLQDAEDIGITAEYDTDNTVTAWKEIKAFYAGAGAGAQLWVMVVSQAVNMATMLDVAEPNYAVKLLNAAGGGVRLLTIVRDPAAGYTPTITGGVDVDVTNAMVNGQALALAYTAQYKPLRVIVPGYGYTGVAGDLVALNTRTENRVAGFIGDTVAGVKTGVGIILGRLAAIPVQRNIGRVKNGSLPILTAYLASETVEVADGDIAVIHGKGWVTFRRHIGKAGYYFTDDPTATGPTDDYNRIARGRVIDKAIYLAYVTYVNELLDEVRINPTTGKIERGQAKYYQTIAETAINNAMTANDEIDGVTVFVDPAQNVLSTSRICVELRIVPVGYAQEIKIILGFTNPANQ